MSLMIFSHYEGDGVNSWLFKCCNFTLCTQNNEKSIQYCPNCGTKITKIIPEDVVSRNREKKHKTYSIGQLDVPQYNVYVCTKVDSSLNWNCELVLNSGVYKEYKNYSKQINNLMCAINIAKTEYKLLKTEKAQKEKYFFDVMYQIKIVKETYYNKKYWTKILYHGTFHEDLNN